MKVISGTKKVASLLVAKIERSTWIAGGEFGPEGSIQAIIFCSIAAAIFLFVCHKENKIVLSYWMK